MRFDDSAARIEDDDDGSTHSSRELKLGMMVEVQSSTIDDSSARAAATLVRFGSEIVGPVTAIDPAAQTLRMLDQTIEVRSNTVFDDSLAGGFAALAVGQVLEIHALFDASSNRYVATRIEDKANALLFRLRGRISALDTGAKTFRIGDAVVNYGSVPAGELPALANGLRVRVRLQTTQVAGQWVAVTIRTGAAPGRRHRRCADSWHGHRVHVGAAVRSSRASWSTPPTRSSIRALGPSGWVPWSRCAAVPTAGTMHQASQVKVIDRNMVMTGNAVELHGDISALDTTAQDLHAA